MNEEIKIKDCVGCEKQPDIFEQYGGGVKVGCSGCGRAVLESLSPEATFEAWNLMNMDLAEIASYAIKELDKERMEWLDRYRIAAGYKSRNSD